MVRINSHAYNIHVDLFPQRHICRLCHKHILFPDSRLRIYSMDQRHTPRQKVIRHKNKAIADQTHSPQAIAVMLRYIFASVDSVILRLARKYIEQWIAWIAVDAVCVALYSYKSIYLYGILYGAYTIVAFKGYRNWKRLMQSHQSTPQAD